MREYRYDDAPPDECPPDPLWVKLLGGLIVIGTVVGGLLWYFYRYLAPG